MPHFRIIMAAIKFVGAAGFVGLLVWSHYLPAIANTLRVAAMAWFFGCGAAYAVVQSKCRTATASRYHRLDQGGLRSD